MAKGAYVGVSSTARKIKKIYVGVNGIARKVKKAYVGVNGIARLFYSAESEFTGNWTQISVDTSKDRLAGHVRAGDYALYSSFRTSEYIVAINSSLTVQYIQRVSDGSASGRFPFGYTDNYAMWASASLGLAVNASLTQSTFTTSGLNISGEEAYAYRQDTGTYLKDKCIGARMSSTTISLSIINSNLTSQLVTVTGIKTYYTSHNISRDISKCGYMYMLFLVDYSSGDNTMWYNSQIVLSSSYTLVSQVSSDRYRSRQDRISFCISSNLLELESYEAISVMSAIDSGDLYASQCCISRMDASGTIRYYYPLVGNNIINPSAVWISAACSVIGKSNKVCLLSSDGIQGHGGAQYYYLDTDTLDVTSQPWYNTLINGYNPSPNDKYFIWCNGYSDHGGYGNGPRNENNIMTCVQCM